MDWLRSAYRVNMILDASQNLYLIDWFRAAPGAALFPGVHPVSLNWSKPEFGVLGSVGEVRTFGTPYSKGGKPTYCPVDVSWPIVGQVSWFRTGAPGPATSPPPITYEGRRAGPLNPAGIFPAFLSPPGPPAPSLATTGGAFTGPSHDAQNTYWGWSRGVTSVNWGLPQTFLSDLKYFVCYPSLRTLIAGNLTTQVPLKCTGYTPPSSTWMDPTGAVLGANEVLTLTGV